MLAVLEVPLGVTYARNERRDLEAKVERDAVTVASLSEGAARGHGRDVARPPARDRAALPRDTGGRVVVVDAPGHRASSTRARFRATRQFASRPEIAAALARPGRHRRRHSNTLGGDLLYVAVPVASGGGVLGAARITYPTSAVDARVRRYWLTLAAIAAIVLAGVALVGLVARARGRRGRCDGSSRRRRRSAPGDLEARAPEEGPAEVRRARARVQRDGGASSSRCSSRSRRSSPTPRTSCARR